MHFAEGENPESDLTHASCHAHVMLANIIAFNHDMFWPHSLNRVHLTAHDNLQVIFYVHQYSHDKELYVDWGFTFVCNVKHGL